MRVATHLRTLLAFTALAAAALPTRALAGPFAQRAAARPQANPGLGEERRAKILDRIETIRIARMTEALNLDSATAQKLFPAIQPYSERRKAALKERLETMRDLKKEFDSGNPDPKTVAPLLDRMAANQKEFGDLQQDEYKTLKGVLDPITLAKYYRFEIEFERNIAQLIRGARQQRQGGRFGNGPGNAPSPDDAPRDGGDE